MTAPAYTCPCPLCRPDHPAPTYTRAWALECEAREVLAMSDSARKDYLDAIEKKRGRVAYLALVDEIARVERNWRAP